MTQGCFHLKKKTICGQMILRVLASSQVVNSKISLEVVLFDYMYKKS